MDTKPKLSPGNIANFGTLKQASANGDLALMVCFDKDTQTYVDAICIVHREGNDEITMLPLALMDKTRSLFERLDPPE
jgi:hypothetical protein